jgi:small-conductance mechanosensitive channel
MPNIILAETFLKRHEGDITAVASIVVAFGVAILVDRWLAHRAARLVETKALGPGTDTRLRILRRLISTVIVVIGVAIAFSQFPTLNRLAASVLASGAIAAAIVGFAARQTLANGVAGIMLASTQPIRIGDVITFENESGTVEDVRLTYTYLRTGADAQIVIPNERLAGGIIRNDSIGGGLVGCEASLWMAHSADEQQALALAEGVDAAVRASIAEVTPEGVRVSVTGPKAAPADRGAREAELRRLILAAWREAGVPRPGE